MVQMNLEEERSLSDLFTELSEETGTLIRQEVRLAKAELSEKASQAGKNAAMVAAGGFMAYAGLLVLAAALVLVLAEFMAGWLAALLVGVLFIGVGYLLAQNGLKQLKEVNLTPERTLETLKEDQAWLKRQMT